MKEKAVSLRYLEKKLVNMLCSVNLPLQRLHRFPNRQRAWTPRRQKLPVHINTSHQTIMTQSYKPPGNSGTWTFGSMWITILITLLVASIPIVAISFGPKLFFKIGSTFGYYLRKKTAGRRAQILELVEADEREFIAKGGRRESDEWETVDSYAAGKVPNREKVDVDWDGIVGFFHPFW